MLVDHRPRLSYRPQTPGEFILSSIEKFEIFLKSPERTTPDGASSVNNILWLNTAFSLHLFRPLCLLEVFLRCKAPVDTDQGIPGSLMPADI